MRRTQAFTIVDVLITIIILGILASVIIPKFQDAQNRARYTARAELLQIYNRASQRIQTDTDLWPVDLDAFDDTESPKNGLSVAGTVTPLRQALWRGPYVSEIQPDPVTGRDFVYVKKAPNVGTVTIAPEVDGQSEVSLDEGTTEAVELGH